MYKYNLICSFVALGFLLVQVMVCRITMQRQKKRFGELLEIVHADDTEKQNKIKWMREAATSIMRQPLDWKDEPGYILGGHEPRQYAITGGGLRVVRARAFAGLWVIIDAFPQNTISIDTKKRRAI